MAWGTAAEPPLSVFCLTDGMDNQSPSVLGDLHSLVRAISGLTGPLSGRLLYEPRAPGGGAHAAAPAPIDAPPGDGGRRVSGGGGAPALGRVPVWLMWIVLGHGGRQFTEAPVPHALTLVDASDSSSGRGSRSRAAPAATVASPAALSDGGGRATPGQFVLVHAPAGAIVLQESAPPLNVGDLLACVVTLAFLVLEAVSDATLRRHRASGAKTTCVQGPWAYASVSLYLRACSTA